MARITIIDHEELVGNYRAVLPNRLRLGTQMELQYQTGWDDKEIQERMEMVTVRTAVIVWATLWETGKQPAWSDVLNLTQEQVDFQEEPGDPKAEDEEVTDPPKAPADSDPAADEPKAETLAPL